VVIALPGWLEIYHRAVGGAVHQPRGAQGRPGSAGAAARLFLAGERARAREQVEVRLYAEHLEVWYGQKRVEQLPRLRGRGKQRIDYRHVIDWLVRKPGALAHYRFREELFPTSRFRLAYDVLQETQPSPTKAGRCDFALLRKQREQRP
jgi:hypothetical protein